MRCYEPVEMETRREVNGRMEFVRRHWLGCSLERGHEGPHAFIPAEERAPKP